MHLQPGYLSPSRAGTRRKVRGSRRGVPLCTQGNGARMSVPLLAVNDLKKHFPVRGGLARSRVVYAVDGVSFHIDKGETLALVGVFSPMSR